MLFFIRLHLRLFFQGSAGEGPNGARSESGFQGRLSRVQVWSRALDAASEIPRQVRSCTAAPVLFPGLLLRWSGYDRTAGGVERVMPSECGERTCSPGSGGGGGGDGGEECQSGLDEDRVPPTVEYCPPGDLVSLFSVKTKNRRNLWKNYSCFHFDLILLLRLCFSPAKFPNLTILTT